jgi:uncharacterized protein DUF2511
MQRLRAFWQSGIVGKLVLIAAGACVGLFACCVFGLALGALAPRPTAQAPTPVAAAAQPTTAETDPTKAPAATEVPATATPRPTRTPKPTAGPERGYIQRSDLGDKWPFTVESGTVRCLTGTRIVFVTGGLVYAVNGTARGSKQYLDVATIWKDNPEIAGAKMDVGPIIALGLSLCK